MKNAESLQVFSGRFPTVLSTTVADLSTEIAYGSCKIIETTYNGLETEVCDITKPVYFQWAAGIPNLANIYI